MCGCSTTTPSTGRRLEGADRVAALAVVEDLHASGMSSGQIVDELIAPTQVRVGELWLAGSWSIGREHATTGLNESVIRWLADRAAPPSSSLPPLLVACIDREEHALAALAVAKGLLAAGLAVHHLAGSTGSDGLVAAVERLQPRAVLLSASLTSSLVAHRRSWHACVDWVCRSSSEEVPGVATRDEPSCWARRRTPGASARR